MKMDDLEAGNLGEGKSAAAKVAAFGILANCNWTAFHADKGLKRRTVDRIACKGVD
jgi:hypothetical protein